MEDNKCESSDISGRILLLHQACHKGHETLVKYLIEKGVNINARDKDGWTPLHCAFRNGYASIARLLIENGADVNAQDKDEWTPLHYACREGYEPIARLLIEKGADVNPQKEDEWTPLYCACTNRRESIAKLLSEKGAPISLQIAEKFPFMKFYYYEIPKKAPLLFLSRKHCPESLVGEDYLPLDLFKLLFKEIVSNL